MMNAIIAQTRILLVEDEAILAMNVQDKLIDLGYGVLAIAESGEAAIRLVEQFSPDLILMDIKLKDGIDGVEAARLIRLKHAVPIVFMTAYGDEQTMQRALATRPQGYLVKPFRPHQLNAALLNALQSPAL